MPMNALLRCFIAAMLSLATTLLFVQGASAAETLRVGKAVPEAFSFVPLDIGMRASPVNAIDSMSRPLLAKKPLRMPMSSGTNENASGTALPTRSVSAAPAPGIKPPAASKSIAAIKQRNSAFIGMARLRLSV